MQKPIPFGKYCLLERVSVGGMAEVFKAKTFGVQGFSKIIAIKRILPSMAEDREFVTMFIDEAKIAVQLNHANICQIYELGKINNSHYIAMEFIHGKDLLQLQNRFKRDQLVMPPQMACYTMQKVCEGLDYAHRKKDINFKDLGLVHRDISPQNIIVSFDGEVKIIDFGIAKAASRSTRTQVGVLKGKFGYMSPEQVRGLALDRRSDVFAAGTVLYEILAARRLFVADSDFATLEKVRKVDIEPPRKAIPDLHPELEAILHRALAREREDRYPWAREMADDLGRFLQRHYPTYTNKELADWMRSSYSEELVEAKRKMEIFARLSSPDDLRSWPQEEQPASGPVTPAPARAVEPSPAPRSKGEEVTTVFAYNAEAGLPGVGELAAPPTAAPPPDAVILRSSQEEELEPPPGADDATEAMGAVSDEEYARIMGEAARLAGPGSFPESQQPSLPGVAAPRLPAAGVIAGLAFSDEGGGTMNLEAEDLQIVDEAPDARQAPAPATPQPRDPPGVQLPPPTVSLDRTLRTTSDPAVLSSSPPPDLRGSRPGSPFPSSGEGSLNDGRLAALSVGGSVLGQQRTIRLTAEEAGIGLPAAGQLSGLDRASPPPAEVALTVRNPGGLAPPGAMGKVSPRPQSPSGSPSHRRAGSRALLLGLGALLLVAAGFAAWTFFLGPALERWPRSGDASLILEPAAPLAATQMRLLLDGREVGNSLPLLLELLPAGAHELRIETEEYEPYTDRIVLAPRAETRHEVKLELKPGMMATLRVHVQPPGPFTLAAKGQKAKDFEGLDGKAELRIKPGAPTEVVVTRRGFVTSRTSVTLGPREVRDEFIELSPIEGLIRLESTPSRAQVLLDGKRVGVTPYVSRQLPFDRTYDLRLRKGGYEEWQEDVRFDGEQPIFERKVDLARIGDDAAPGGRGAERQAGQGWLTVSAGSDVLARIIIDGQDTGKSTPVSEFSKIPLSPGEHLVTLKSGAAQKEARVVIEEGKTTRLKVKLP
ncbi:MAG: protein kinase [Myxococcota bacterium]|nr:protein kinase [Myxococcota bacterium]